MVSKAKIFVFVLATSLALIGGASVVGLLQSSERIGSSGIVVRPAPPPPPPSPPPSPSPPPPEPSVEIDIFGDVSCTKPVSNVVWGSLEPGGSVSKVVYVRNSGETSVVLSLLAENWSPSGAANYLSLSWDYGGKTLGAGVVLRVALTLSVDSSVSGIEDFSFDIVIVGSAS